MTEWGVVGVIIALAGLAATVLPPILKLNASITKLNITVSELSERLKEMSKKNTEAHRRLWEHNDEQDKKLENHEQRIHDIEKEHENEH